MARYKVQAPDGSILVLEGPDDATPEQISQAAEAAYSSQQAQPVEQPAEQPKEPPQSQGLLNDLGRQAGLTARYGIEGVANTVGIFTDPLTLAINKIAGKKVANRIGDEGREIADSMGLPTPQGKLENIVGAGSRAIAGVSPMVGAGNIAAGATNSAVKTIGQSLASNTAAQATSGATGGIASQAVKEEGGGAGAQLAAALVGGVVGGMTADKVQRIATAAGTTAKNAVVEAGAQHKVPVMTTDVVPPKSFTGRMAQSMGEKVPIAGMAGKRVAQQAARVEAVKRFAEDVGGDLSQYPDYALAASLRNKRAADITKYTDLKTGVFDKVSKAGPVPANNIVGKIDDEVARLNDLGSDMFAPITKKLQDLRGAIEGKNINQVETLRKAFGETLKTEDFASVKSEADKVSRAVYRALNQDIEQFIKATAGDRDVTKWKVANARLSSMIGELDSSAFKTALNKGDVTPEAVRKMLLNKNASDTRLLFKSLTEQGRAAARTTIVKDAIDKAGGFENVSPQRFVTNLEKLANETGVFFTKPQRDQAEGLIRVIKATQRASEAAAAPPTGIQNTQFIGGAVLADLFGSGGAAVGSAATVGGIARVYESPAVRNLMIHLSKTTPGSDAEGAVLMRLLPAIQSANDLAHNNSVENRLEALK